MLSLMPPIRLLALPAPPPRFIVNRKPFSDILRSVPNGAVLSVKADSGDTAPYLSWDDGAVIQARPIPSWQFGVFSRFSALVPTPTLKAIASKATDDYLSMGWDGARLEIKTEGAIRACWNLLTPRTGYQENRAARNLESMPARPDLGFTVSASAFLEAYESAREATGDSARFSLAGVHLELCATHLEAIGTDGARVHTRTIDAHGWGCEPVETTIPNAAAQAITKFVKALIKADKRATLTLSVREDWIFFTSDGSETIALKSLEGRFPRWRDAIPATAPKRFEFTLDVDATRKACDGLAKLAKKSGVDHPVVDVRISEGAITLSADWESMSRSVRVSLVNPVEDSAEFRLNVGFLESVLSACPTEIVHAAYQGTHEQPLEFTSQSFYSLLMPIEPPKKPAEQEADDELDPHEYAALDSEDSAEETDAQPFDRARDYLSVLKISADSPSQLRPCDVERVIDKARDIYDPELFAEFVAWLEASGISDLCVAEIVECLAHGYPDPLESPTIDSEPSAPTPDVLPVPTRVVAACPMVALPSSSYHATPEWSAERPAPAPARSNGWTYDPMKRVLVRAAAPALEPPTTFPSAKFVGKDVGGIVIEATSADDARRMFAEAS